MNEKERRRPVAFLRDKEGGHEKERSSPFFYLLDIKVILHFTCHLSSPGSRRSPAGCRRGTLGGMGGEGGPGEWEGGKRRGERVVLVASLFLDVKGSSHIPVTCQDV